MPGLPRDLLKPRQQRLAEVMSSLQLQAGQPNSQMVVFGCVLAVDATTTKYAVSAGEYCLGQALVEFAGAAAQVVPAGANPGAGLSVIVNIEGDSAGALSTTIGAFSNVPVAPALTPAKILLAQLVLPGAFTPGTTVVTAGMCVQTPYSAGNQAPLSGF